MSAIPPVLAILLVALLIYILVVFEEPEHQENPREDETENLPRDLHRQLTIAHRNAIANSRIPAHETLPARLRIHSMNSQTEEQLEEENENRGRRVRFADEE